MIAAVVLAAGLGTRMGAVKPLLTIDGRTSLERVLATIDEAGIETTVVVLGREPDRIRSRVDLSSRRIVVNPAPEAGLSSSLRLGIEAIPPDAAGILVFHADMPYVRATTVLSVCRVAARGAKIAASIYRGARGFPVYFARGCLEELLAGLAGDSGGRRFLERHADWVTPVEVDDPGAVRDLDRPTDVDSDEEGASCATSA